MRPSDPVLVLSRTISTDRRVLHLAKILDIDCTQAAGVCVAVWLRHVWVCQIRARDGAWFMMNGSLQDIDRDGNPDDHMGRAFLAAGLIDLEADGVVFAGYGDLFEFGRLDAVAGGRGGVKKEAVSV